MHLAFKIIIAVADFSVTKGCRFWLTISIIFATQLITYDRDQTVLRLDWTCRAGVNSLLGVWESESVFLGVVSKNGAEAGNGKRSISICSKCGALMACCVVGGQTGHIRVTTERRRGNSHRSHMLRGLWRPITELELTSVTTQYSASLKHQLRMWLSFTYKNVRQVNKNWPRHYFFV